MPVSKSKKKPATADKQPAGLTKPEVRTLLLSLDAELTKARIAPDAELDDDQQVYLYFTSVDHLNRFMEIITKVEPGETSLYRRIVCSEKPRVTGWSYHIFPVNVSDNKQHVRLEYRVGAFFPPSDLPEVLERVKQHNVEWDSAYSE
jgi:hypothetical protein